MPPSPLRGPLSLRRRAPGYVGRRERTGLSGPPDAAHAPRPALRAGTAPWAPRTPAVPSPTRDVVSPRAHRGRYGFPGHMPPPRRAFQARMPGFRRRAVRGAPARPAALGISWRRGRGSPSAATLEAVDASPSPAGRSRRGCLGSAGGPSGARPLGPPRWVFLGGVGAGVRPQRLWKRWTPRLRPQGVPGADACISPAWPSGARPLGPPRWVSLGGVGAGVRPQRLWKRRTPRLRPQGVPGADA